MKFRITAAFLTKIGLVSLLTLSAVHALEQSDSDVVVVNGDKDIGPKRSHLRPLSSRNQVAYISTTDKEQKGEEMDDEMLPVGPIYNLNPDASSQSLSTSKKRNYNIHEAVGTNNVEVFEDIDEENEMEYVIVTCPDDQTLEECNDNIQNRVQPATITVSGVTRKSIKPKVKHQLTRTKSLALELTRDQLKQLNMEYEMDPVRELLVLPGSARPYQGSRNLQTEQEITDGIRQILANDVWSEYGVTGEGVTICVIDSGLLDTHEDFQGADINGSNNRFEVVTPWNQDGNGHGTHVTGTIGARSNSRGVVGVAPDVDLFIVRVFDNRGVFRASDIQSAAEECRLGGADIISMSLGGTFYSSQEELVFQQLYDEYGIISVAAAGNSGNTGNSISYPAAHPVVVSVGAVTFQGNHASFSTRNEFVDISAPGVGVLSTANDGDYEFLSGTSMACPHVSGVLALLKSFRKNAAPGILLNVIASTATDKGPTGRDNQYGEGIINALEAMKELERLYPDEENNNDNGDNGNTDGDNEGDDSTGQEDGDNNSDQPCKTLDLLVITDNSAEETGYRLTPYRPDLPYMGEVSDTIYYVGYDTLNDRTVYEESECLDISLCYQLNIYDERGDGIFGRGRGVRITYDDIVVYEGRRFGYGGYLLLGDSCP